MEELFECTSVVDVKIPEGGNANFFKPEENSTTKIRFLKGPKLYSVFQEWTDDRKPIGNKEFYVYGDKKTPTGARLTFSYIIYNYAEEQIQTWDIATKGLLKSIKAINDLNPQLSAFDCSLTKKKGSNGFMEYTLVNGAPAPFINEEVINDFKENDPFTKLSESVDKKIKETSESTIETLQGDDMVAEADKAFA